MMNKMEIKYPATLPDILQESTDKFELSSDVEMPKTIVINTGPLIAIIAGLGDLNILGKLYNSVIVPYEVTQEILAKGEE